jgi:hypothetical protein
MEGGAVRTPACCIVAGHSHVSAFGGPLAEEGSAPVLSTLAHPSGRFRIMMGEWPRTEAYWSALGKAAAGQIVALLWFGNQHLANYLLAPDPRFDFVLSSEPHLPLDEAAIVLPESLIRESFMPSVDGLRHLLRYLHKAGAGCIVCGTPPPTGDDSWVVDYLVNNPRWFKFQSGRPWLHRFSAVGPIDPGAITLTPRVLRYKLWAVLQDLMREIAAANAVPFLACPGAAQTVDGFLRDEYRRDITHANTTYGALVMEDLWPLVTHADGDGASARERAHAPV